MNHKEAHMQSHNKALTEEENYECDNMVPNKAERIVQELIKKARMLSSRGYGITQLVFSDCSFVSLTDSGVLGQVVALLRAGCQPLGFVAAHRELNHSPFAEPWERGDQAALAELRDLADWLYGHRMRAGEMQR